MDPYQICPTYETKDLRLRLVETQDAYDLLKCYSDQKAVAKMNADNCTSDFYYTTIEQMQDCINFWLKEYKNQVYVRFSIIIKKTEKAVGTVEMFDNVFSRIGKAGVLRIDLADEYETSDIITQLAVLSIDSFMPDFNVDTMIVKTGHTPERAKIFKKLGFVPTEEFCPGMGYYSYQK